MAKLSCGESLFEDSALDESLFERSVFSESLEYRLAYNGLL